MSPPPDTGVPVANYGTGLAPPGSPCLAPGAAARDGSDRAGAAHRGATIMQPNTIRQGLVIVAQVGGFWAICESGFALTKHFGIAVPGNLLGMVMLFVLMASGIVKLEWVNAGATLLLRHLAFFFIPIAVGLMTMGDLMRSHGIAILAVLLASAAAGILVSGRVVQAIANSRSVQPAARREAP